MFKTVVSSLIVVLVAVADALVVTGDVTTELDVISTLAVNITAGLDTMHTGD